MMFSKAEIRPRRVVYMVSAGPFLNGAVGPFSGWLVFVSPLSGDAVFLLKTKIRKLCKKIRKMDRSKEHKLKFITHIRFPYVRFLVGFPGRAENCQLSRRARVIMLYFAGGTDAEHDAPRACVAIRSSPQ